MSLVLMLGTMYLSTFDMTFGLTSKDSLFLNHVIILGNI